MQKKERTAIYARVSTADGRQDTENQLAELRRFASTQNWEIAAEYIDHESGGRADRREFCQMFTDVAQRRFDLVLVWALDRFTREGVGETFEYIRRLTSHGVHFVSFTEEHFRTRSGRGIDDCSGSVDRQAGARPHLGTSEGGIEPGKGAGDPFWESRWKAQSDL
jgi:DNA invertase Pin-like site-specific DNA recombinase